MCIHTLHCVHDTTATFTHDGFPSIDLIAFEKYPILYLLCQRQKYRQTHTDGKEGGGGREGGKRERGKEGKGKR